MITLEQCTAFEALAPNEIVLRSTPSAKHRSLLASYLLNLKRGPEGVRDMMVSDLRPRSGATSGGFADRAAAVSFRLPGSQTYATFGWTERPFGPHADSALIGADAFRRRHCAELVLARQWLAQSER
jgi:hypothetical protein